jgi:stage II sporulation protein AA (anti-sigma F factor antagonist)
MSMEYQIIGNNLVVRLAGELDLVAAAAFKRTVDDLLDRRRARNVLVNLQRVTFLDSSFLGALLGRYRRLHQAGAHMAVIGTAAPVRPTLELSGIFRLMADYSTEPEALKAAGATSKEGS